MIKVDGICKSYGKIKALCDVSFEIAPNEITGFIGKNGSGKSTAMNIITGCLAADCGTVETDGFDVGKNPIAAKSRIGYLPEKPPIYASFTVREYLKTAAKIKNIRTGINEHTAEIAALTGLSAVLDRRIGNLSKGYCQRMGLAQAILGYPRYIVLDEPTVGLDPKQKADMLSLIKKISEKSGILLSSHILSEIDSVCNRLLIIDGGRIIKNTTRENILARSDALVYEYKLNTETKKAESLLARIHGVLKIEKSDTAAGYTVVTLRLSSETVCEAIFYALAKENVPIIYAKPVSQSLESAFLELTDKSKKG